MFQPIIDFLENINRETLFNILYMFGSAMIGYWLGVAYSKSRWRKEAIYHFEIAFLEFIYELQTPGRLFPKPIIDQFKKAHDLAFRKFISIDLTHRQIERLGVIWDEYKAETEQYYIAPMKISFNPAKKEFIECIERLIKKIKKL